MKTISKYLIKLALFILPLTPDSHKTIEPILNNWVNKLNKTYKLNK